MIYKLKYLLLGFSVISCVKLNPEEVNTNITLNGNGLVLIGNEGNFQNGNAYDAYNSLFNKLLKLPEKTLVYPAHDYNGKKFSSIENEKKNNPRLQVSSPDQYAEIMDNLNLANPKMMDVAVPANVKGLTLDQIN